MSFKQQQAGASKQAGVTVTAREVTELGASGDMAPESKHIQPLLIPDSSKGIRGSNDLPAMLLEDLCGPRTHVAKALQDTVLSFSINRQDCHHLPAAASAAAKVGSIVFITDVHSWQTRCDKQ